MVKCAVLRDGQGNITGVMRGDYTLMVGWVEEEDIGQNPPPTIIPPMKRMLTLKDTMGKTQIFEVVKDEAIPV